MRKSIRIKQKSEDHDDLDSRKPKIAGTVIEATVSETTIAFHYEKNGAVREFLATPSGWLEVPPGDLINDDLAHGYSPKLAMDVLEDRVDSKKNETLISMSMSGKFPLWTAPARVPLQIAVSRGRRSFKQWMTRNDYRWAVPPESGQVHLVTRGGRPVEIPGDWRSAFNELASGAQPVWGPAVAYVSLPLDQLRWAEAIVLRERGARLCDCRAGHRFVWIGRATKKWCSLHERERDALETRYRRASPTEKKLLVVDLKRLGLRRTERGGGIRPRRRDVHTGRGGSAIAKRLA